MFPATLTTWEITEYGAFEDFMADEDENKSTTPDQSSRDSWLNSILGPAGDASKTATQANEEEIATPPTRAFKHQLFFKSDFRPPSGAKLTNVEVREVPEQVYAVSGEMPQSGTWTFKCDHLDSVTFYVDDINDLRQSTAVVAKFMLIRDEDQRAWSEVEASQLVLVQNATEDKAIPAASMDAQIAHRDSCVASMIALDVSIDVDGPQEETPESIKLSGLASGAILTAGKADDAGTWSVDVSDLKDLAIIVPDDTPAFDMNISLGNDGESQDAKTSIRVEIPPLQRQQADNTLMLRFSASSRQAPHRIHIFADGREIYDQVLLWGDDPDIPLDIIIGLPGTDDLPFELLIREESITQKTLQSAVLLAAEFNEQPLRLGDDLIRGNVTTTAAGLSWRGDLILSARDFVKNTDTKSEDTLSKSDDHAIKKDTVKEIDPIAQPSGDGDLLIIHASSDDIHRSGFIEELGALQAFVRARSNTEEDVFYERLGLTVKSWRDVKVVGPTDAEVELSPSLPSLAPQGGRDNALVTIGLNHKSHELGNYDFVEFRGLPTGCLLTHGRNLGDGRWLIPSDDIPFAHIIGLVSSMPAAVARIFSSSLSGADESEGDHLIGDLLIGGASRKISPAMDDTPHINVSLDSDIFDPEGHGALSLTIGDVPSGVLLTQGANHGDGVWTHETHAGDHLGFQVTVPRRSFSVSITCVAMNSETGESTVITHRARIRPYRMEVVLDQAINA